jgi:hypothetical protein
MSITQQCDTIGLDFCLVTRCAATTRVRSIALIRHPHKVGGRAHNEKAVRLLSTTRGGPPPRVSNLRERRINSKQKRQPQPHQEEQL